MRRKGGCRLCDTTPATSLAAAGCKRPEHVPYPYPSVRVRILSGRQRLPQVTWLGKTGDRNGVVVVDKVERPREVVNELSRLSTWLSCMHIEG